MKIALINPPFKRRIIRRWYCSLEADNYLYPPIELCYLSSILKKQGFNVEIIDCIAENIDSQKLACLLNKTNAEYAIFMPGFQTINEDVRCMVDIKKKLGIKLVCFGHYPTIFSSELIKNYSVDYIINGEPEITVSKLFENLRENKSLARIKGLCFRLGNKIINNKAKYGLSLDKLPFPDRQGIAYKKYHSAFPDKKNFTAISSSRGCLYNCVYCIYSYNKYFRMRNSSNTIAEMEHCKKKLNVNTFRFLDDNFITYEKSTENLCELMIKKKLSVDWACLARPHVSEKLLRLMKKAGCKRVLYGIESGSKRILSYYNRSTGLSDIRRTLRLTRKLGIKSLAFVLIGAPIENSKDIKDTFKLIQKLRPNYLFIDKLTAIPGSKLFEYLNKKGDIHFTLIPYSVQLKSKLGDEEFNRIMIKWYLRFYTSPRFITRELFFLMANLRKNLKTLLTFNKWIRRKYWSGYYPAEA